MIRIHPSVGEKFYFRLLLKNDGRATSYENLKVVNGIQHPTYHSACVALGLARGDQQWIDFMEEACALHFPKALRIMFCNILINCSPQLPSSLLARFGDAMAEDFLYTRINTPNVTEEEAQSQARNDLLLFIEFRLMQANKSMSDFNLPIPSHENTDLEYYRAGEVDPEARTFFEENIDS